MADPIPTPATDNTGALIRFFLTMVLASLLSHQWITQAFYDKFIAGLPEIVAGLGLLGTLVWSLWQKWRTRQVIDVAMTLPAGASKATLAEQVAKQPMVPKITGGGTTVVPLLVFALALPLLSGCKTFTLPSNASQILNPSQADKAVVIAGQTFESTMKTLVILRQNGKITDSQWTQIDGAQKQVNQWGPVLADEVIRWKQSGVRGSFDIAYNATLAALTTVQTIQKGVTP